MNYQHLMYWASLNAMSENQTRETSVPEVRKVIWNNDACVVLWRDGTKTVVHCQEGDVWSKEIGLMAACSKKLFGNAGAFNNVISRYCSRFYHDDERIQKALEKLDSYINAAYNGNVDKMMRATYMTGAQSMAFATRYHVCYELPAHAKTFMKLAKDYFENELNDLKVELSVVTTKDNGFKIVLAGQKGE